MVMECSRLLAKRSRQLQLDTFQCGKCTVKQTEVKAAKQPEVEPVHQREVNTAKQLEVEPVNQPEVEPFKQLQVESVKQPEVMQVGISTTLADVIKLDEEINKIEDVLAYTRLQFPENHLMVVQSLRALEAAKLTSNKEVEAAGIAHKTFVSKPTRQLLALKVGFFANLI
uniref:Uncharacterized protein n=1 Tax=Ditylenchus dipsaci TaxID=166011 RepID=A0A915EAW1_9BILA